jgi:hypothetical protein
MAKKALKRYRAFRALRNDHNHACMGLLCRKAMLDTGRAIGLVRDGRFALESEDELTMVYDLCIHAARAGRSRAIDRYAHAASFAPSSPEALTLAAMQRARFSIWQAIDYYPDGGLVLGDVLRGGEIWFMDEAMTLTCPLGLRFAARLFLPEDFAMSTGVLVPFDENLAAEVEQGMTPAVHALEPSVAAGDYRFAQAVYRAAVATNAMARVGFTDTPIAA